MSRHRHGQAATASQWKVRSGCAAVVLGLGAVAVTLFGGAAAGAVSDTSGTIAPTCVVTTAPESSDTTGPATTEPETTEPETTDTTRPETTEPETTDTTEPETIQPETTDTTQPETTQPETTITITEAPPSTETTTEEPPLFAKRIDLSGVTTLTLTALPSLATCDSSAAGSVATTAPADDSSTVAASAAVGDSGAAAGSAGVAAESDSRSAAAADTGDLATTGGPGTYVLLAGLCLLAAGILILISTAPNRIGRHSH